MSSISIGNFDGVHLGHRALLAHARSCAGGGTVTAVTFEPHPTTILCPGMGPDRLTNATERRKLLLEAGADEVRELVPTPELLGLEAEAFLALLRSELDFDVIVEGVDFRFARGRSAGVTELAEIGQRLAFSVDLLDPVSVILEDRGEVLVRSSLVRWLLRQRRPVDAARALGRPYRLVGTVVPGDKRGRTLGFPTANLDLGELLLPGDGVYAGVGILPDGTRRSAAISIGAKPTFGGTLRQCEAHLLDHDAPFDDYGWLLEIDLVHFLRDQLLCEDVADLLVRISRDCEETRRLMLESTPT